MYIPKCKLLIFIPDCIFKLNNILKKNIIHIRDSLSNKTAKQKKKKKYIFIARIIDKIKIKKESKLKKKKETNLNFCNMSSVCIAFKPTIDWLIKCI